MQRIADIGYLITMPSGYEMLPSSHYMTCFSDASNVAVDEARLFNCEVLIVVLSLKGTKKEIDARREARNWERTARVITTAMIAFRWKMEGGAQ